jgi:hypothetical protein
LKQIDFLAAIHLTSDELEARDLTSSLSVGTQGGLFASEDGVPGAVMAMFDD